MSRHRLIIVLVSGWAVAFLGGFGAFALTPSKDFGLSAGWNRAGIFMAWELAALVIAVATLPPGLFRRTADDGTVHISRRMRWLSVLPIGVTVLAGAVLAGLIWYVSANPPLPPPHPGPVTAPTPTR